MYVRHYDKGVERSARVPFIDLSIAHEPLRAELSERIETLFESSWYVNGPEVEQFEVDFAEYCGTAYCVGLASGLDALRLALLSLEVGPGDEVIVPAQTFVATFEAVSQIGAIPVPVEIGEDDYGIDPTAASAGLTERTRAIVPVHLFGQVADVVALRELSARHALAVVEDACQAHGASRAGHKAGSVGDAAAFSFYPSKNLGAIGDAGALVTNDPAIADRVRALREHGQRTKYEHDEVGWTARLDTIQAIALLSRLPRLDAWNQERRTAAAYYLERLAGVGDLRLPQEIEGARHVWHLFVIRTADPVGLGEFLVSREIRGARHYPTPPHLTAAYSHLGYPRGAFPVAEALARECISLPMFPGITEEQLELVVAAVRGWFGDGRRTV